MPKLTDTIVAVATKARKFSGRKLGEQNTKASLIEPILEALGWDIRDPDEVHREFRGKSRDNPVDYALKILRKPRLFVEAKGLDETLGERKWVAQMLGDAAVAGVEWCVLTDGDEYRFYNAVAPVDADDKLFHRVQLTDSPATECARGLSLISKDNLEQNILESLWSVHYVDRRVKAALLDMVAGPDPSLVRMVRKRADKLTPKDIADSLRRLDVQVESPAVLPALESRPVASAPKSKKPKTAGRVSSSLGTSLSNLIDIGALVPPLRLYCRYRKQAFEACVLPSGEIEFQGRKYSTPSAAASAARETLTGKPMATNGWSFWRFDGPNGSPRELGTLRPADAVPRATDSKPSLRLAGGRGRGGG
ncbi:MAG: hypothetical protein ACF8R9_02630 [Phycisphaerales bacterium JB054]